MAGRGEPRLAGGVVVCGGGAELLAGVLGDRRILEGGIPSSFRDLFLFEAPMVGLVGEREEGTVVTVSSAGGAGSRPESAVRLMNSVTFC